MVEVVMKLMEMTSEFFLCISIMEHGTVNNFCCCRDESVADDVSLPDNSTTGEIDSLRYN